MNYSSCLLCFSSITFTSFWMSSLEVCSDTFMSIFYYCAILGNAGTGHITWHVPPLSCNYSFIFDLHLGAAINLPNPPPRYYCTYGMFIAESAKFCRLFSFVTFFERVQSLLAWLCPGRLGKKLPGKSTPETCNEGGSCPRRVNTQAESQMKSTSWRRLIIKETGTTRLTFWPRRA